MKVLIVTQARIGSSRLPNKVLMKIGSDTILGLHLKRLAKCKNAYKVVVATTKEDNVSKIITIAKNLNIDVFQGSTNDVLDRYYNAANQYLPDYVVRVTSDCPLIDPELIDEVINKAISKKVDYCSNVISEDFPDGQDVEVFKFKALQKAWRNAVLKSDREHVTPYIRNNSNKKGNRLFSSFDVKSLKNYNHLRMTVDQIEDLEVIRWLVSELGPQKNWLEYANYMLNNKSFLINSNIIRNDGYIKSLKKD